MLDNLPNSTCESSELEESPHLISTSWARFATWPWVFGKPTTAENSKHLRFTFFQRTRFFNKMPKDTDLIVRVARTCSFLLPPARQQQISRINEVTNAVQGTVLHGQGARRDGLCFHVIYWSRRDFNKRLNTSSNQVFTVKRSAYPSMWLVSTFEIFTPQGYDSSKVKLTLREYGNLFFYPKNYNHTWNCKKALFNNPVSKESREKANIKGIVLYNSDGRSICAEF